MSLAGHGYVKVAKFATWLSNSSYITRALNDEERRFAAAFFTPAVDLDKVEIAEKASGAGGRAFVAGNTIYMGASSRSSTPSTGDSYWVDFLHEMVHVWQYQVDGADYAARAMMAQMHGDRKDWRGSIVIGGQTLDSGLGAYDYVTPLVAGLPWSYFNPEAQAELVSELWKMGWIEVRSHAYCRSGLTASTQLTRPKRKGGTGELETFSRDRSSRVDVFLACLRRGKGAAVNNTTIVDYWIKWDQHGGIFDQYD